MRDARAPSIAPFPRMAPRATRFPAHSIETDTAQDPEPAIAEIRAASPAEREVMRLGLAQALRSSLNKPGNTASRLGEILKSYPMRRIFGEIFPAGPPRTHFVPC
jgi:hypothetical protein